MTNEYFFLNIIILLSSSLGIYFTKKANFPKLVIALRAILTVSLPYLFWDWVVTNRWWQFNPRFILNLMVGPLPVEEILFFAIVPWSCLVIWVNLRSYFVESVNFPIEEGVFFLSLLLASTSFIYSWWYTLTISILLIIFSIVSKVNSHWMRQKNSLLFLLLCFVLTIIFNGYLTARPIVIYEPSVKSNLNLLTIPSEDIVYGLVLVGLTAQFYDFYTKRLSTSEKNTTILF